MHDFDLLEKEMLDSFYKYVKSHKTDYWVHWNMRNPIYGFDAIANRYKILGGNPVEIEDQFRFDLNNLMFGLYTKEFEFNEPKGRMLNIAERNKITVRDALTGKEEADAFAQRDYQKLFMSTARKVEIIDMITDLVAKDQLLVNTPKYKIYGLSIPGIIEMVKNNWILTLLVSVCIYVLGIISEDYVKTLFSEFKIFFN
ncbi:hypothetical protein DUE52_14605 [Larkinella punicea]|uniref:Uncharacterized protein n=2 Tax=Larkinella punicea TaxID=2315727 RepID=A0A368JM26_9BACT|nr:hypothetical protein DUE52_14605 [Larkinella punicea]